MKNFLLKINDIFVPINHFLFSGGESMVKIDPNLALSRTSHYPNPVAHITMNFRGNSDLFDLALLVDAIRRSVKGSIEINLSMDYLPYARQDRVMTAGESLSVKVLADFINSLNFERVYCRDIHSDVGVALVNNLVHIEQHLPIGNIETYVSLKNTVLVSPDGGALKKIFKASKRLEDMPVIRADKTRDVSTGAITGTKVYAEDILDGSGMTDKDFLVVDDICDGGKSFTELAKELRKITTGKLYLYITHGIFSKGAYDLSVAFDRVFVYNLMNDEMKEELKKHVCPFIKVI